MTSERAGGEVVQESLEGNSRLLWWIGLGFYGVGDTFTTVLGHWAGRAVEAGPIVSPLMGEFGLPAVFAVKVTVLVGFFLAWRLIRSPGRVGIPLALAVVGVAVTVWNGAVLLTEPGVVLALPFNLGP